MQKFTFSVILTVTIFASLAVAQDNNMNDIHPLSGKIGLSLEGGMTYTFADFHTEKMNVFGRTMFEYFFPTVQPGIWGIRAFGSYGYLTGSGPSGADRTDVDNFKTTSIQAGAGVEYLLKVSDAVFPYVFVGGAFQSFDPKDKDGNILLRNSQNAYSKNEWNAIGEVGFRFLVSRSVSLNIGGNVNYFPNDNLDDVVAGKHNDIFFTGFGGLTVYLGGKRDADKDGVSDDEDSCPGTPQGVTVDEFGCPIDSDGDDVPDYLDKCPDTPNGIIVDKNGCPLDTDEDGVPDYQDLCKDTPAGVAVDKQGCPFDEDGDGVPDYKDKCPGTPIGSEVNSSGCIPEVNKKEIPEKTSITVSGNVLFEVGKSNILPGAITGLNEVVDVMTKHPGTRWVVAGHTDNTGSYELNKKLSYARANSVADYLVQNGISRSRLEIVGFGPDQPIANNSTAIGRAMNRRVTIDFIEGDHFVKPEQRRPPVSGSMGYDYSNEKHVGNMIFTDGNTYVFQVASFRTRPQAEQVAQSLNNVGEKAFVVEANLPSLDGIWYRVRVGYYPTLYDAQTNRTRIMNIIK